MAQRQRSDRRRGITADHPVSAVEQAAPGDRFHDLRLAQTVRSHREAVAIVQGLGRGGHGAERENGGGKQHDLQRAGLFLDDFFQLTGGRGDEVRRRVEQLLRRQGAALERLRVTLGKKASLVFPELVITFLNSKDQPGGS